MMRVMKECTNTIQTLKEIVHCLKEEGLTCLIREEVTIIKLYKRGMMEVMDLEAVAPSNLTWGMLAKAATWKSKVISEGVQQLLMPLMEAETQTTVITQRTSAQRNHLWVPTEKEKESKIWWERNTLKEERANRACLLEVLERMRSLDKIEAAMMLMIIEREEVLMEPREREIGPMQTMVLMTRVMMINLLWGLNRIIPWYKAERILTSKAGKAKKKIMQEDIYRYIEVLMRQITIATVVPIKKEKWREQHTVLMMQILPTINYRQWRRKD
jgi:hypothetical protein